MYQIIIIIVIINMIIIDPILLLLKLKLYDIPAIDLSNSVILNKSNLFFLINRGDQNSLIVHK